MPFKAKKHLQPLFLTPLRGSYSATPQRLVWRNGSSPGQPDSSEANALRLGCLESVASLCKQNVGGAPSGFGIDLSWGVTAGTSLGLCQDWTGWMLPTKRKILICMTFAKQSKSKTNSQKFTNLIKINAVLKSYCSLRRLPNVPWVLYEIGRVYVPCGQRLVGFWFHWETLEIWNSKKTCKVAIIFKFFTSKD